MAEAANAIAFFDCEATGLNSDYNSIICISVKPYGVAPMTFVVKRIGFDLRVVREARDFLSTFPLWVSYYGKGFDVGMINGRLLKHELAPLPRHHHIDEYFVLRHKVNTARHSQAHLLEWLGTPEKKMTLSPDEWNAVQRDPRHHLPVLIERCESDVAGLEALYKRTRHLIMEVTR